MFVIVNAMGLHAALVTKASFVDGSATPQRGNLGIA
jgi:hypothetical protein